MSWFYSGIGEITYYLPYDAIVKPMSSCLSFWFGEITLWDWRSWVSLSPITSIFVSSFITDGWDISITFWLPVSLFVSVGRSLKLGSACAVEGGLVSFISWIPSSNFLLSKNSYWDNGDKGNFGCLSTDYISLLY